MITTSTLFKNRYKLIRQIGEEKYIAIYSTPEENKTNNEEAT